MSHFFWNGPKEWPKTAWKWVSTFVLASRYGPQTPTSPHWIGPNHLVNDRWATFLTHELQRNPPKWVYYRYPRHLLKHRLQIIESCFW
jgi:hypothetical protein